MLGLGQEVRRDLDGVRCSVGQHHALGRPGQEVDAHLAGELHLRRGDPRVAGADDAIHGREARRWEAEREGADGLRASGDQERIDRTRSSELPAALDYLEGELPDHGYLFGEIGIADIAIASFFRNGSYAGFVPDAARWPRTSTFVELVLRHPAFQRLQQLEMIQLSTTIEGRRKALLDAGAKLTEDTYGQREPRKGIMRL